MNPHTNPLALDAATVACTSTGDSEIEQIVLHHALRQGADLDGWCATFAPRDFEIEVHRRMAEVIHTLHEQSRALSLSALRAHFGDEEHAPGQTVWQYIGELIIAKDTYAWADTWEGTVQTWHDRVQRRDAATIGSSLAMAPISVMPLEQILNDATDRLDTLRAAKLSGPAQSYSAGEATAAFLDQAHEPREIISTGFSDLDEITGGWKRRELTIPAARPAMGKTTLLTSSALRSAKTGRTVMLFSLEMSRDQLAARMLADEAYVARNPIAYADLLKGGTLQEYEQLRLREAQQRIDRLSIRIDEQRGLTMSEIAARTRKRAEQLARQGRHLDVLMVDHLGLIRPSDRYSGNRHREIAEITNGLAALAKDLDIAVVAACQLNRSVEGRGSKVPQLADLRDSGSIEEDARLIAFLYRPAYYLEMEGKRDDAEAEAKRQEAIEVSRNTLQVIIAKNSNGPATTVNLFADMCASAVRDASYGGLALDRPHHRYCQKFNARRVPSTGA